MILYAQSVMAHLRRQIEPYVNGDEHAGKLLFMMPAVPAAVALESGKLLSDYCAEHETLCTPLIKAAAELCREWESSGSATERDAAAQIAAQGWRDERGNLTSYRNTGVADPTTTLVVLLIGVDRVTDSSSLADFHHCDVGSIWGLDLGRSFSQWTRATFEAHEIGFEEDTLDHFDQVMIPLLDRGLADIFQISCLLEELDLSSTQDGRDAEQVLLRSLTKFGLPVFGRCRFSGRASFGSYLDDAVAFYNYDSFLEERSQKTALATVEKFMANEDLGELFDESERGAFDTDEAFVAAVGHYVGTRDQTTRAQLLRCDFVTIRDRILGYRPPKEPKPKKETVKKLSGGPVEVVLTGVWSALAEFKRAAADAGILAHESLREIRVRSQLFKHDCDEGASSQERTVAARQYLARLMGGIDAFLQEWLDPTKLCGDEPEVVVVSELIRPELNCQPARTGEPNLQFSVTLVGAGLEDAVTQYFAWRLPEIEPYRLAAELVHWEGAALDKADGYCLPVFHLPYHEELMLAKDDEETRRVLRQCVQDEGGGLFNLLGAHEVDKTDPLLEPIQRLAFEYDAFIQCARSEGLHTALMGDKWNGLRKAYERACDAYLRDPTCAGSPMAPLLFRAFLVVQQRPMAEGDRWVWDAFEPSAVVTVLHPGLLEMLQAHVQYLVTCFNTVAGKELQKAGPRPFRDIVWRNYVDLAAVETPLCGLLKDRNKLLDTDVRGEGLVHRIGDAGEAEACLTTRLLLRYDSLEDEDLSDAELFRESRESLLICRILTDYRKLHPHVDDGLSIAVFRNHDIQPVISAVDRFLSGLPGVGTDQRDEYALSVTFFTESSDDSSVTRWIGQWRERWEAAENQSSLAHYRRTRLSVAHRIVSSQNYYSQFQDLIARGLEVDVAVLCGFIGAGAEGNDFELVEPYDVRTRTLKFPILEKSFCALRDPGRQLYRARVLSNRQFSVTTRHAELMARLSRRRAAQNEHHVVLGFGDYTPWQGVVDALHRRAGWVVCIDPNIDERLIAQKGGESEETREIIGFGSGVGAHGEANYTISTEQFRLGDVLHRLTASIGEVYGTWSTDVCREVAESVLTEARRLSGLSLVRATGLGEYIRDFMAYALTRKMLKAEGEVLCNHLVSLDAYQHWFDSAETDTRPDLLWVVARVGTDGRVHVDLRLIECKLAKQSDAYLDKAHQQLDNGLRHLVAVFMPRDDSEATEDDRPDQRYWWLQLHRLIASTAEITIREQTRVLTALERLAEGDYDIEWRAAAVTFWTDDAGAELSRPDVWIHAYGRQEAGISVLSCGSEFVRHLCAGEVAGEVLWDDRKLRFETTAQPAVALPEDDGSDGDGDSPKPTPTPPEGESARDTRVEPIGDPVDEAAEVGSGEEVPDRILLGSTANGSRRIYWEFGHPELSNRHLLIFGTSGMGKTYTIQCILCELGRHKQNSLIVDYTNGFMNNQLEQELKTLLQPVQHYVQREPLPINPFRQQIQEIDDEAFLESASSTAQRVAGVFSEVYSFGDQQKSALYQAIKGGLETGGEWGMTLQQLIPCLEEFAEQGGAAGSSAASAASKIRPFVDQDPFGTEDQESWERLFTDPKARCHILQLANFARDVARLITEFSLIDLYRFYRGCGSPRKPRVVVLDEIQNLDHRAEGPLGQLLTEGRKFGFSLVLATQIMSNLGKDERDRLFNAAHKLFFRPADTEMRTYADIAGMLTGEKVDIWLKRLAALQKGECYSLGPSLNTGTGKLEPKVFRVCISPLSERM